MPIYGKFENALVREVELLDGSGNLNSTDFTLHSYGMLQPSNASSRSTAAALTFNYDQTTSNPHYVHYITPYHGGAGYAAPWGILINKKLKPGEIMTISGYFVRGQSGSSGDGTETANANTSIQILYENRPGEMQSFTREGESVASDGLSDEGMGLVLPPTGKNVGIVSPWEYSSGESYGDYFPASNSTGTGYEATCNLYNGNIHSPTASEGYPRYYRIRIGNDSENEAAIKIIAHKLASADEASGARIGIYKLKVRVEKSPQYLESARIGINGDLNFRDIPSAIVFGGLSSGHANEPHNTRIMLDSATAAHKYSWMVRSLNGFHSVPGAWTLPLGGTDAFSEDVSIASGNSYDFEDGTNNQVYLSDWNTNTGDNTGPVIKEKNDGSNKIYAFIGARDHTLANPPHSQPVVAGGKGWRWVELTNSYAYSVKVSYRVYEAPGSSGDPYGLNNDPEAPHENFYMQYKVGPGGTWTTYAPATILADQIPKMTLSTLHEHTLNVGQDPSSPLYLRWLTYTENSTHDYWGIDDVSVVPSAAPSSLTARTNRVMVAPNDGHLRALRLKWENQYTGDFTIRMLRLNTADIDDNITTSSPSYVSIYAGTLARENSTEISISMTVAFSRGDVLALLVETQTDVSTYLGSILGTCVLRFKNESLRVET